MSGDHSDEGSVSADVFWRSPARCRASGRRLDASHPTRIFAGSLHAPITPLRPTERTRTQTRAPGVKPLISARPLLCHGCASRLRHSAQTIHRMRQTMNPFQRAENRTANRMNIHKCLIIRMLLWNFRYHRFIQATTRGLPSLLYRSRRMRQPLHLLVWTAVDGGRQIHRPHSNTLPPSPARYKSKNPEPPPPSSVQHLLKPGFIDDLHAELRGFVEF